MRVLIAKGWRRPPASDVSEMARERRPDTELSPSSCNDFVSMFFVVRGRGRGKTLCCQETVFHLKLRSASPASPKSNPMTRVPVPADKNDLLH